MSELKLGIIGGGQLGSMLSTAAKKLNIKSVVYSDDVNAPAQKFADQFIFGSYNDKEKIKFFLDSVDKITFEFENIPFSSLNEMNNVKTVLPNPKAIKILQNRTLEKDFLNNLSISTTQYVSVSKKADLESNQDLLPGIIKTLTLGYDGKGQFKITDLDDDFVNQIETNNTKLLQTYDAIQEIVVLLKVDMLQLLSVTVDYIDADGD